MTGNGSTIALIQARGGSKGVPDKNLRPLGGFPLLAWSVVACTLAKRVDRVVLSTDSERIADVGRQFGAEVPFLRPAEYATDTSTDYEVLRHALEWFEEHDGALPEMILQIRPTTPLRDPAVLDAAIERMRERPDATGLRSVYELVESPWKMFQLDGDFLVGLRPDDPRPEYFNLPRQMFPPVFNPQGYVDIVRPATVLQDGLTYGKQILSFITPDVGEIDCEEDLRRRENEIDVYGATLHASLKSNTPPTDRSERLPMRDDENAPPADAIETKHRRIVTPIPVPEARDILDRIAKYESEAVVDQPPVIWDRTENHNIFDPWGNCWIDFSSSIFVTNAGHGNPAIAEAISTQANKLMHAYSYPTKVRADFLESLIAFAPDHLEKASLYSAGTEATERAVKLARLAGRRHNERKNVIIAFEGAYHGKTMGAQMIGGNPKDKEWIGYHDPNVFHLPFPYPWVLEDSGLTGDALFRRDIDTLLSKGDVDAGNVAAFITEPYQGWAATFLPKDYVQEMARWSKHHDALLIVDEIQGGFGRCGRRFAFEHYEVAPDLVCCGKGISNGFPLSAVLGRGEIIDLDTAYTSTHGGHPMACAAGLANLEVIVGENLVAEAARKEQLVHQRLERWRARFGERIGPVYGKGLLFGVFILKQGATSALDLDNAFCDLICDRALEKGVFNIRTGRGTLKFGPPLTIPDDALLEGLDVIEDCIAELLQLHATNVGVS